MNISIIEKGINEINLIKPLWEGLNSVHFEKSISFKEKYMNFTFEKRIETIHAKANKGIIKFDVVLDSDSDSYVGYCISSIEDGRGEIESIFIHKDYRKFGQGKKLMERALKWFNNNGVKDISINVVYANEEALPFYENFGFNISNYILKRR
ncbi:GNAT family N-acetyltransferase [Clostridium paridis]|uniref:GNAT family N-acetyltransferase n=1 Tax=Clostridium paridis TaxID=2803863 RepID=A0A937K4R2_9CLOT|nr:GNAT family N-acetyltransferase [Clostridium paridis]MBL4932159.1 GNAT family N-acetyltransferase [Clostridium paridis]